MTAFDRFDPFERRITEAIDEIAAPRLPDYLNDILQQTARTTQRPRWTFLERWLPVDTTLARPGLARRFPVRQLLILALVGLLAVAAGAYIVGSQHKVPAPFGPAGNGLIAYESNSDLYVRDSLTGTGRLLVGGNGDQIGAYFSPDGSRISYATNFNGEFHIFIANADATAPREVATISTGGDAFSTWSPDSRQLALITVESSGRRRLSIASVDGTPNRPIDLGTVAPWDVSWSRPDGGLLLVRGEDLGGTDLFTLRPDGTGLRALGLLGRSAFGPQYTLSGAAWSPDGKSITYNSVEIARDGSLVTHFRVGRVTLDGTQIALPGPADPRVQEAWPIYSPDGKWILVHRWTWKSDAAATKPEGWLAIMPADGSALAHDIGPRIAGGEDTGLAKTWSPDGTRVLAQAGNTEQVFSIDPVTGAFEELPWTNQLPDWQRIALP